MLTFCNAFSKLIGERRWCPTEMASITKIPKYGFNMYTTADHPCATFTLTVVVFDLVVLVIFIKLHTEKVFSVVGVTTLKMETKKIIVRRRNFYSKFFVVFIQMSFCVRFTLLDLVCATCVLAEEVATKMRKFQIAVASN